MSRKHLKPGHLELINQRGREPIQPPRLLGHIQKNSLSSCEQLLAHLFSATDDLFYDLSKRASSNNEQNLYFEAMREIRIKREGIASHFLRRLADDFHALIESPAYDLSSGLDEDNDNKLSIVDGDDLEVDLARGNMISRTRDAYREELYELGMRLDHLLLQVEVNEDNNPLDPSRLTAAFVDGCQTGLSVNIKAKLILYKLFEKHVLKQLGHIYADANQTLLDAGILPKVPKHLDKRIMHGGKDDGLSSSARHEQTAPTESHIEHQPLPNFRIGYDALSVLMTAARNIAFGKQAHSAGVRSGTAGQAGAAERSSGAPFNCYIYTTNPGPVMASPELTTLLTQSQPTFDQQLASAIAPRNIVAAAVQQLLTQKDPATPQALEQNDENVINLVAMFFDEVLSDPTLPMVVQSLVCRLQIPTLKVALKDRTFFSNPEHPARKLINIITSAGVGFDESKPLEKDPLYKKIVDIVQTLNRQYKADDRIFSELHAQLEALIERERRKSGMVEQRTAQAETGKSRIKQARAAAQGAMYQKLKAVELPDAVKRFLTAHWLQVMVITHLKHGIESSEWVANEQAITDLIWMCNEHQDTRSIQRRERLLPELLDRIEAGLEAAIDNPDIRTGKVTALEQALRSIHADTFQAEEFAPLSEEQKDALGKGEDAPKNWDEMTAVERQQSRYEELSSGYYEMAKHMSEGSWLEYHDEGTGKKIRCKLASKIDAETYIFVNRFGFKALEKSRKQFAYDMQFNRAKLLDTRPMFDRVMGQIVDDITNESGQ